MHGVLLSRRDCVIYRDFAFYFVCICACMCCIHDGVVLVVGNNNGENFPQEFLIQIYERIQKVSGVLACQLPYLYRYFVTVGAI